MVVLTLIEFSRLLILFIAFVLTYILSHPICRTRTMLNCLLFQDTSALPLYFSHWLLLNKYNRLCLFVKSLIRSKKANHPRQGQKLFQPANYDLCPALVY